MENQRHIIKNDILNDPIAKELIGNDSKLARYIINKHDLKLKEGHIRKEVKRVLDEMDFEIVEDNVRLSKQKQKYQDTNRIERKSFREYARIENAVSEFAENILEQLKAQAEPLKELSFTKYKDNGDYTGLIQVTDVHFNELIDLPHNKYDFEIASKRLKKLSIEAVRVFRAYGIKKVLVAFTGDLLNSDRRLDELLNQATNRSKATILSAYILQQFLLDISQYFTVEVVSVLGNESRVHKEMSFANNVISDNFDFTIISIVKQVFEFGNVPILFHSVDKMEEVVNIRGHRILITHDLNKATSRQKDIQATIGRLFLSENPVDFIIGGHLHATRLTDLGSRSSSLGGSNAYNEIALNLSGRAGQNIFIFTEGSRHQIAIDLQNTDDIEGYNIIEQLEAYNAKSIDKTHKKVTTLKIII